MSPRPRAGLRSAALAAASSAVTLLVLEVAFRLAGVSVGTVQINRATVRRNDNPRLRFELRPGSVAHAEVEYRINALGLRGPQTTTEKPAGVRRVAVLGDSIAFGYWVADEHGFARQLEAMLTQAGGAGGRIEVLNFGVPGYNLDQELEVLRSKALDFSPDVVVVVFCLNDLEGLFSYEFGLVQDRAAHGRTWLGRAREWLIARSVFVSWVEYRLTELEARRGFVKAKDPFAGPLYAEALSQQKKALQAQFGVLHDLLASRGIPGMVVVVPLLGGRFERYRHRELHGAVVEAAEAESLAAADLFDCYSAYAFRELRVDVVHPSPLGHRVAAHAVRDALCARGWLCDGVPPGSSCRDYRASDFPSVKGY